MTSRKVRVFSFSQKLTAVFVAAWLTVLAPTTVAQTTVMGGGAASSVGPAAFPLLAPNGTEAAPSYAFSAAPGTGIYRDASGNLLTAVVGTTYALFATDVIRLKSTTQIGWAPGDPEAAAADTGLARAAAGIIKLTNGSSGDGTIRSGDGTVSATAYGATSQVNAGLFFPSTTTSALAANGQSMLVTGSAGGSFHSTFALDRPVLFGVAHGTNGPGVENVSARRLGLTQTISNGGEASTISGVRFTNGTTGVVQNSTTEGTLIATASGLTTTFPASYINEIGKTIRVHAMGNITTDAVSPGTLQLRVKLGTSGTTTIVDTGANTLTAVGTTARFWEYDAIMTVRATGATGTIFGQGGFKYHTGLLAASFEAGANTATTTLDLTAAQIIDFTAQWGTADPDNVINCTNLIVELLN